ncbi:MAG: MBL fold metallo-hydrolase [Anaerolineae bacterium]|nr:MBL fold metallo-hydrolase [Anaerolineae bacterium]
MIIETLAVGQLQTNCYVIADEQTRKGAIVDPGGHADTILKAVNKHKLDIRYVVNTHAHFDHMLANADIVHKLSSAQKQAPKLAVHPDAVALLQQDGGARMFGFSAISSPDPDLLIGEGDELAIGALSMRILHTPGHSPGSICLYCAPEKVLFGGDVLFLGGIGRTDLPGGDWDTLMNSITNKLFALPDEVVVYPGHGMPTTIGRERKSNPFVRVA